MSTIFNSEPCKKLSLRKKQSLYQSLGSLLLSSIDILTAIEIIIADIKDTPTKFGLQSLMTDLRSGRSFAASISDAFNISTYERATIHAGESSGKLAEVLKELGNHFKQRSDNRRQLISLLSYPAIVLITSVAILYFMLSFMVPMFMDSFRQMDMELPYITQLVISGANAFKYAFPVLAGLLISVPVAIYFISRDKNLSSLISDKLFTIPWIKKILIEAELRRFFIMMSTLISANVQFTEALLLAAEGAYFPTFKRKLIEAESAVINGDSIHEAFSSLQIFPIKAISMMRMAEETNSLSASFSDLRDQFQQLAIERQQLFKSIAEPVLILIMGMITGTIVISMYLPIFQMSMVE